MSTHEFSHPEMYQKIQIATCNEIDYDRTTESTVRYLETYRGQEILDCRSITILGETIGRIAKIQTNSGLRAPWIVELDFLDSGGEHIPRNRRFYERHHAEVFVQHIYAKEILLAWHEQNANKPMDMDVILFGCGFIGTMFLDSWKYIRRNIQVFQGNPNDELRTKVSKMGAQLNPISLTDKPRVLFLAKRGGRIHYATEIFPANYQVVVSAISGSTVEELQERLKIQKIVRIMTNLGGLHGKSLTITYRDKSVTDEEYDDVVKLLKTVGSVIEIHDEKHMDLIAASLAAGPGYMMCLTNSLRKACVEQGLPEGIAEPVARNAVIAAASVLENSNHSMKSAYSKLTNFTVTARDGMLKLMHPVFGSDRLMAETVQAAAQNPTEINNE